MAPRPTASAPDGSVAAPGVLYVVSTPIGNLGDITLRALDVLREVALILAEDTRQTRVLLARYDIRTPTVSLHGHNEARSVAHVLRRLASGRSVALVSDAGTPLISDPGHRLVGAALARGFRVVPIPGAAALLAALSAAGVDASRFTFFGFLPRSGAERAKVLRELSVIPHTSVLYESPERLVRTLEDLVRLGCGDRPVVIARELTKRFEEFRRGTVSSLATYYAAASPRGEIVVIVEGRQPEAADEMELRRQVRTMRETGASARDITTALVREHGVPRNVAYRLAHDA